jgi:hypothetical protein
MLSLILLQISDYDMSTEVRQVWESTQDSSGQSMAPWKFSNKFPYNTQFIFGSLIFATGDDGSLESLTQGLTPRHPAPVYGQAPYLLADPSILDGDCLGLNPHAGPYHLSAMTSQGYLIGKTIL